MAGSKKTPGINGSSMADISFILLIFFLMVTTMGTDYGLMRQLPPWSEDNPDGDKIKERNVFVVSVNQHNNLLVEGQYMDIAQLKEKAKDFFNLRNTGEEYPEKKEDNIPLLGNMIVNATAVVSLQNDRGTSYKTYIQVQNELAAAVHELRDELSMQRFGSKFDDSSEEQQAAIAKVYPMAISEAEPKNIGGRP